MGKAQQYFSPSELESMARGLFNVKSKSGDELVGLCPSHDEKNVSFSYNVVKDVGHCFSCGFGGDIIRIWSLKNGFINDEKGGFVAFCKEFNIRDDFTSSGKSKKKKEIPSLDEAYGKLAPLPDEWKNKFAKLRGWSAAAMDYLGIRMQSYYRTKDTGALVKIKNPDRLAIPVFDDIGAVRNIRCYKPGDKKLKIFSWGKDYGQARLFPPAPRDMGTVLLCEGEPDTICAISNGFNAITQTTKPKKWAKDQLEKFRDREVVIAFDADQAGVMFAMEYAGPQLHAVAKSVRLLEWPDFMGRRDDGEWPEEHGQDLTDFFVKHKQTAADLQALIDAADHFEPPDEPVDPLALRFFKAGVNGRVSFKARLLANKILEDYQLLHCPDTGLVYRWNKRYWEEYSEDHLKAIAVNMLGKEAQSSRVMDAMFQVKALANLPHGRSLNDQDDWICLKNGMLNINTLELKDHEPDYYSTIELNVTFNPDSENKCERWLQFMDETIQTTDVIKQVQEFFGYCFYKKVPFAKCLLLLGPGSDGKSTFINVLTEMIGEESCASISFDEMEDQFMRSSLYQKSVNVCGEVGSKVLESTYFKAVTAGDWINAAFKHKNTFSFRNYAKVVFSGNKMPRVKDTSDGLYRRLLPIKFKRQFLEGAKDTDPYLEDKLRKEYSEIFLWSMVGLRRLLSNKRFTHSDETEQTLMEYKRLNNPVLCFAQDECVLDEASEASKKDLFKRYEGYCRDNNYRAYSRENFFRELYAAFNTLKTYRPRVVNGIMNPGREPYLKGIRLAGGEI